MKTKIIKNPAGYGLSKGLKKREATLLHEYKNRDKIGAIIDKRNKTIISGNSDVKVRQQVIAQKLENDSKISSHPDQLTHKGKLLSSLNKFDVVASDDDSDNEIGGDIVSDCFFSDGLLKKKDNESENHHDRKTLANSLQEKIAQSKLERYEKQEEIEEIRDMMSKANDQWADQIRFLEKKVEIKPKRTMDAATARSALAEFEKSALEMNYNKKAIPSTLSENGTEEYAQDDSLREKQISKLSGKLEPAPCKKASSQDEEPPSKKSKVDNRLPSADNLEDDFMTEEHDDNEEHREQLAEEPQLKSPLNLLRIMAEMKEHHSSAVVYLIEKLNKIELRGVKDTLISLMYCQVLFEILKTRSDSKSSNRQPGIFSPELIRSLYRLLSLSVPRNKSPINRCDEHIFKQALYISDKNKEELKSLGDFEELQSSSCQPDVVIHKKDLLTFRVAVLYRLVNLIIHVVELYSLFPSANEIFTPFLKLLNEMPKNLYPQKLTASHEQLSKSILNLKTNKRTALKVIKKPDMLPLLEPRFETKFTGQKKESKRRQLQKKVKKEMRGAMKEIKMDAQFIAKQQLKQQLANDADRKSKTKKLLSQLANQEGELRKMKFVKKGKFNL